MCYVSYYNLIPQQELSPLKEYLEVITSNSPIPANINTFIITHSSQSTPYNKIMFSHSSPRHTPHYTPNSQPIHRFSYGTIETEPPTPPTKKNENTNRCCILL